MSAIDKKSSESKTPCDACNNAEAPEGRTSGCAHRVRKRRTNPIAPAVETRSLLLAFSAMGRYASKNWTLLRPPGATTGTSAEGAFGVMTARAHVGMVSHVDMGRGVPLSTCNLSTF